MKFLCLEIRFPVSYTHLNGQGDMCLEMLEFLEEIDYPIEEYLDTDPGFREKLDSLLNEFSSSEGIHPCLLYTSNTEKLF